MVIHKVNGFGIVNKAEIDVFLDLYSQGYSLHSDHVQLWELDCKEGSAPKNWCLQTMVLVKTPESLLDSKEIKPVDFLRVLNAHWKD